MVYWRWWCWRLKEYDDAISVVWDTIGVDSGVGSGSGVDSGVGVGVGV